MEYEKIKSVLDRHQTIGWDVDSTLIKGPNSKHFQRYIVETPMKAHHIVTFRTGDFLGCLPTSIDVEREVKGFDLNLFDGIHGIPDERFARGFCTERFVPTYMLKHEDVLHVDPDMFEGSFGFAKDVYLSDHHACFSFKAETCKKIGASVLIDDMVEDQKVYCRDAGIMLFDAIKREMATPDPLQRYKGSPDNKAFYTL